MESAPAENRSVPAPYFSSRFFLGMRGKRTFRVALGIASFFSWYDALSLGKIALRVRTSQQFDNVIDRTRRNGRSCAVGGSGASLTPTTGFDASDQNGVMAFFQR